MTRNMFSFNELAKVFVGRTSNAGSGCCSAVPLASSASLTSGCDCTAEKECAAEMLASSKDCAAGLFAFWAKAVAVVMLCVMAMSGQGWAWSTSGVNEISKCDELISFANWVNEPQITVNNNNTSNVSATATFPNASASAKLTRDLYCSGETGVVVGGNISYSYECCEKDSWMSSKCTNKTKNGSGLAVYSGTFDGDGHTISNLNISSSSQYVGLFGYVDGGTIKNVKVENSTVTRTGTSTSKEYYTGVVVGYLKSGTVTGVATENSSVAGSDVYYQNWSSGGIAGYNGGTISECSVVGGTIKGRTEVGGIAGTNAKGGTITDCLASPDVLSGSIALETGIGGIAGKNNGDISRVVYTGDRVSNTQNNSRVTGGPITGSGSKDCEKLCYYTENVGLKPTGGDAHESDIEKIKETLGAPWDVADENLIVVNEVYYYTVTIDPNGHGDGQTLSVKKNQKIESLDSIRVGSYKRIGLCKNADCSQKWNLASDQVTGNITLYAEWAQAYTVTFTIGTLADGETGSFPSGATTVKYCVPGEKITADGITSPNFASGVLAGWSRADDGTVDADLGTMDSEAVTVYAIENNSNVVNITYKPGTNGIGSEVTQKAVPGATVNLKGNLFTREEYAQDGWATKDGGNSAYELNQSITVPASGLTLFPHWKSTKVKIEYKYSESSASDLSGKTIAAAYKAEDADFNLTNETFTQEGFRQDGWSLKYEGNKSYDMGAPYNVNENTTFYPHWIQVFTVTFNANGHGAAPEAQIVDINAKAAEPAAPSAENYTFNGWNTSADGTGTTWDFNNNTVTANTTLYAMWRADKFAVIYKYTIDGGANYTIAGDVDSVAVGATDVEVRPDYMKDGYTMSAWSTEDAALTNGKFTMPAKDVVFTSTGTVAEYDITYNLEGGTNAASNPAKYTILTNTITLADASREGYAFDGWYSEAELTNKVTEIPQGSFGAKTLFAKWTIKTHTITYLYSIDGGTTYQNAGADPETVNFGTSQTRRETYVLDGYEMSAWTVTPETLTIAEDGTFTMPDADVVFKTIGTKKNYTISYFIGDTQAGDAVSVEFGGAITPKDTSKVGYTFSGWTWYSLADVSNPVQLEEAPKAMPAYNLKAVGTFTPNQYTATFDANNGEFSAGVTTATKLVAYDATITADEIATPTRTGYVFKGWSLTQDAIAADADLGTMNSTEGVTIYAVWVQTFTVTFNKNGHGSDVETQTVESGSNAVKPDDLSETGYTFAGWFTDDGTFENAYEFSSAVMADVTLYAKWTVQVTFDMNDHGDPIAAQTVIVGKVLPAPTAPTANGFRFDGWFTDEAFQSAYNFNSAVTAALVLHAKWTTLYTVTWKNGDATVDTDENVAEGTMASDIAPTDPTKTGYTFSGWNDGATTYTVGEEGTFATLTITGDATFTAQWDVNSYNATFDANNGEFSAGVTTATKLVAYDATITADEIATPTREGYTFNGWSRTQTAAAADVNLGTMNSIEGVTIYAVWQVNEYTITLNANGGTLGTGASPITQEYGSAIQTRADPTKTGYTFAGWFENEDLSGSAVTIPATMPAKTYTLYAKWTPAEVNYTVKTCTMETDGTYDESKCSSETRKGFTESTADATPKTFDTGFELDSENSTLTGTVAAEGNLVLSVYLKRIAYAITFVNYDNALLQKSDFLYGAIPVYSAATPTKAADAQYTYAFAGWSQTITEVTGTVTYTAQFTPTPVSYTLTWDFAGGTAKSAYTAAGQVPYGTTLEIPEMEKEGYGFQGWSPKAPTTMPADNLTLTATWAPNQYTITFDSNGGSEVSPIVADYGATVAAPAAPTRDGYTFVGWFTDNGTFADAFSFSTMPLNGKTVYAKWDMDVQATAFAGTYDGEAHGITVTAPAGATVTYSTAADGAYGDALTYTEAGEYTVYYKASQEGYADVKGSSTVTINQASGLTVSLEGATFTYDGAEHVLTKLASTNALTGTSVVQYQFEGDGETWTSSLNDLKMATAGTYTVNVRATNPNYSNTATGSATLTINKAAITVNVTGSSSSVKYDGEEHSVSGYTATSESGLFNAGKVQFSGTVSAVRTIVGKTDMGLKVADFRYNDVNIAATFNVTDGYQEILAAEEVIVKITGHSVTKTYDGTEATASGYDISASSATFDKSTVSYSGTASVKRTEAGTTAMNLDKDKFSSTDANFSKVTFEIAADGYVTINKKTAEITWSSAEFTYTGLAQVPTATVTNLVTGDECAVTVTGAGTDAGNYTATATELNNANYVLPESGLTKAFSIAQATIIVETESATRAYNGEALTAGGSIKSGLVNGETASIALAGTQTNVGTSSNTFSMNWGTAKLANYKISSTLGVLEVTPAAVTVTADAASKTYGAADPTLTATVTGTIGDDEVEYTLARVTGENVGTYTITASGAATQGNYSVTYEPATFTIKKATFTVTGTNYEGIYDGESHGTAATLSVTEGTTVSYSVDNGTTWSTTAPTIKDVGEKLVTVKAENENYETAVNTCTLKVTKRAVTLISASKYNTYDGIVHSANAVNGDGFVAGEVFAYSNFASLIDADTVENTFEYATGSANVDNYAVAVVNGKIGVAKRSVTFTGKTDTKTFTGSEIELTEVTAEGLVDGHTHNVTYSAKGTAADEYIGTITAVADVKIMNGTTDVTANYDITTTAGKLTIAAAEKFTIALESDEGYTYDGTAHHNTKTVTSDAVLGATTFLYQFDGDGETWVSDLTSLAKTDAGTYTINVKATNPNYAGTATTTAKLTIAKKAVVVKAIAASKIYGETDPTLASTVEGLVTGESETLIVRTLARAEGEDVGEYEITASGAATQGNYSVSFESAKFTINQLVATLDWSNTEFNFDGAEHVPTATVSNLVGTDACTVTVTGAASAAGEHIATATALGNTNYKLPASVTQTFNIKAGAFAVTLSENKTYNGTKQTPTVTVKDGTKTLELNTDYTVAWDNDGFTNAGDYKVSVIGKGNYTGSVTKTYTILKKAIAVAVSGNNGTATYDGTDHKVDGFTATTEETLYDVTNVALATGKTASATTKNVAKVPMNLTADSFVNNDANFTVTFTVTDGYSEVTPKAVVVKATAAQKTYGETDPTLTSTVKGLVEGESETLIVRTVTRATGENVGTYTITASGEAAQGNYSVTYETADFTINAKAIVVAVSGNNGSTIYDGADHTITGFTATTEETLYDVSNVVLATGKSATATTKNVGKVPMGLTADSFVNNDANFTVTFTVTDGYSEVTPKSVVVKADAAQKIYGAADPTFTATVEGLVGEDKVTYTVTRATGENVGTYTITASGEAAQGNYSVTYETADFTINAKAIVVAVSGNNGSTIYDGADHPVTGFTATTEDELYNVNNVALATGKTASATTKNVGKVPMGLTADSFVNNDVNFTVTFTVTDGYSEVTPKAVVVKATAAQKIYGAADPTLTSSVEGLVEGESESLIVRTVTRATGENVGTYAITASGEAAQGNYSVTYETADFTINAKAIVVAVSGNNGSTIYDGADHTVTGFTATTEETLYDVANVVLATGKSATATTKNVGKVPMGLTADSFVNNDANFTVTFTVTDGYSEVTPKAVVVKAIAANKTYGEADPTLASTVEGLVEGESESLIVRTVARATGENVGTYTITASGEAAQGNYSVTYETADFTINAKAIVVAVSGNNGSTIYDGADHPVTGFTATTEETLYNVANVALATGKSATATTKNVGKAMMNLTAESFVNNDANFSVTFTVTDGYSEVTPKSVVVKATAAQKIYGAADPTFTATVEGLVGEDKVTYTVTRATGENVGTYTITASGEAAQGNYSVTYETADFTINAKAIVVAVSGNNGSTIYDGADHPVTGFTATTEETLYDVANVVLATGKSATATTKNVGKVPMGLTADSFVNTDVNFTVTFTVTDGYSEVTAKAITVAVNGNNGSTTYDGADHPVTGFTATTEETLYDVSNVVLATGKSATATTKNVGKTMMNLTAESFVNNDANFTVTFTVTDGYSEVTPKAVVVKADAAQKTYGEADPTLASTVEGLVEGESESLIVRTVTRATGENVGTYTITASGEAAQGNYSVTYETADFTINAKAIVVAVNGNNGSTTYDGADHTITGFTATTEETLYDVSNVVLATGKSATATTKNVGKTMMNLTAESFVNNDANFTVTFTVTDGYSEVTPKAVVVKADAAQKTYGEADPTLTSSVEGLVEGESESLIVRTVTRATGENVGTYAITASGEAAQGNYSVTYETADFTINAKAIVVAVSGNNGSTTYDGADHPVTGFTATTEETLYDVTNVALAAGKTASATTKNVGKVPMGLTAESFVNNDANFTVTFTVTDGYSEVTPKAVVVKADAAQKTYGEADPTLASTVEGLVEGESESLIVRTVARATGENVGTYTITASGEAAQGNYSVTYETADFTINAKAIVVAVSGNNGSTIYDGGDHPVTGFTATTEDELYNVNSVALAAGKTASATTKNVGKVPMGLTADSFVNNDVNFTVTFTVTDGYSEVTPKAVVVKATAAQKTYGEADPTLASTVEGLVEGESESLIVRTVTRATGENVGTYTITASGEAAQGNYSVTYETADFTITPKAIVVAVSGKNASTIYDGADHTVTGFTATTEETLYDVSNVVLATGKSATATTKNVAKVPMNLTADSFVNNDVNFTVTFTVTDGYSEVTPKAVVVKATAAQKTYGETDPTLTSSVEGLVEGESESLIVRTVTRATGENVGTYTITASGEAAQGNYEVAYETAVFTINARSAKITVASASKMYGDADPTFTYKIEGLVDDNDLGNISVIRPGSLTDVNVGTYTKALGALYVNNTNYTITLVAGDFAIYPRTITLMSASDRKFYDGTALTNDEVAVTEGSFVEGESATYDFTGAQTEVGSSDNTFAVSMNGSASADNYEFTLVYGKLIVDPVVTFVMNGHGTQVDVQNVLTEASVEKPETPTETGYTFNGWFTDDETFANEYDFESSVTKNITLYAKWSANEYDLTIHYVYAKDDSKARDDYKAKIAFDSEYNVSSPIIANYTADNEKVSGTMNSVDGVEITVKYTSDSYKIVVVYGDTDVDTLQMFVNYDDSNDVVQKKILSAMESHEPKIALPTRNMDQYYSYEFSKFIKKGHSNVYKPEFTPIPRVFHVTFNLPKKAQLDETFDGYTFGELTYLPTASIKSDCAWEFKGWYTEQNGMGTRVKAFQEEDYGEKTLYPLFQTTIAYNANGTKGELVVLYSDNFEKVVARALEGVIPEDYAKDGKTYTFDKWVEEKGIYRATFTQKTGVVETRAPRFVVAVQGRALEISGAKLGAKLAVYNMQGRLVSESLVTNGTERVELSKPGSYVVRVNNQTMRVNVK